MKSYLFIALMAFIALGTAVFVPPRPGHKKPYLGEKECTYGPSFWCQNLTAAAGCNAVKHCIQTVWIHKTLPPDTSSVCQTCLDIVKQARDQLLSNDTEELIKEVFEGSCALLHLKPVVKECDKLCDNYIPELIDTLASQMNPQVVCSVAGLCNNEKVHKLLEESGEKISSDVQGAPPNYCQGCRLFSTYLENKFKKMSRDDVLHSFLDFCGNMGSFSDGCSNIIITYFNEIYDHLQKYLNADEVCLLSGDCRAQFHQHANVEITPLSHTGYVKVIEKEDDLPCELCEQLVGHLRDVLIANTTEDEFELVLNGLCKQTGKFSEECLGLVSQYYEEIYNFLVKNLNSTAVCHMIGTCNPSLNQGGLIAPLLPVNTAQLALTMSSQQNKPLVDLKLNSESSTVNILPPVDAAQQLPIELLTPPHNHVLYNKEVCAFCEYFLHYVQQAITDPKTEGQIKSVIDAACEKLPPSVNNTCLEFVDTYEPAMVAILAQEIDPSQVCPLIRACPSGDTEAVEIFMEAEGNSKCPLCLVAVTQLESMVKDEKTEVSIKQALDKLCDHLSSSLKEECLDFVQTYTDELVEMLIADLKPAEVCEYLKLCNDNTPASTLSPYVLVHVGGDINTNMIPDNTINGKLVSTDSELIERDPQCVLCEFVMSQIEHELQNKKTDENIEKVVRNICKVMPSSVKEECNNFVDQYADVIIQLLIQALEPNEICSMMQLCTSQLDNMKGEILVCPVCEMTVEAMERILRNPKVSHDVEHVLEKTCRGLPEEYWSKCRDIIDEYGEELFKEIAQQENPHKLCKLVGLCSQELQTGTNRCTYGPGYWCKSEKTADECNARKHCEGQVWHGSHPQDEHLVGSNRCTWGPGYWCASEENADRCGAGARSHCESKVWGASRPKRSSQLGKNPCTHGPGYWCESEANADRCGKGARTHCENKVWNKNPPV